MEDWLTSARHYETHKICMDFLIFVTSLQVNVSLKTPSKLCFDPKRAHPYIYLRVQLLQLYPKYSRGAKHAPYKKET